MISEIVKITFEDCGYAFACVDENGRVEDMLFCFSIAPQYKVCNECELRECPEKESSAVLGRARLPKTPKEEERSSDRRC